MSRVRNLLQAHWLAEKPAPPEANSNHDHAPSVTAMDLCDIAEEHVAIRPDARLVYHTDPHGAAADRFRLMRIRLHALRMTGKLKKLLITSPLPGDGKSTVSLNLATALSEGGARRVLVVDADLHHSPLTVELGLSKRRGLAECLAGSMDPLKAVCRLTPLNWHLLAAGKPVFNPTELLQGQMLPSILDRLTPHFDWIVINSPPVIPLSEVLILKDNSDGALLVVRAHRTAQDAVEESVALLGKQHILGVILNAVDESDMVYSKYGYGYAYSKSICESRSDEPLPSGVIEL